MSGPNIPKLLNVNEAAERLGVSVSYLNKLRLTGGGPPYAKLGARVAYDQADLTAWVETQKQRSTSEYGSPGPPPCFPDATVRTRIVAERDQAFAVSYLDPSAWDPATRTITPRTSQAKTALLRELRTVFADLGVTIIDPARPDASATAGPPSGSPAPVAGGR